MLEQQRNTVSFQSFLSSMVKKLEIRPQETRRLSPRLARPKAPLPTKKGVARTALTTYKADFKETVTIRLLKPNFADKIAKNEAVDDETQRGGSLKPPQGGRKHNEKRTVDQARQVARAKGRVTTAQKELAAMSSSSSAATSGMTYTQTRTVKSPTLKDYTKRRELFQNWAKRNQLEVNANTLDQILSEYLDHLYFEGARVDAAERIVAAERFFRQKAVSLPLTQMGLKGYRLLSPTGSRYGLPWEWVAGLIMALLFMGLSPEALAIALIFNTYMRPGEGVNLLWEDAVPPIPGIKDYQAFGIIVAPSERNERTKTNLRDHTIMVDSSDVDLTIALQKQLKAGRKGQKLFPQLTLSSLNESFQKAVGLIGLDLFELSLYQLRHGGASRDALTRRRDLQGIMDRGNWACMSSVKRYEKAARMQQALARSPSRTLAFCRASLVHLQAAINSGRCLVELP